MKIISIFIIAIMLTSCSTILNERMVSSQQKNIEMDSTISLGEVTLTDKNNLLMDTYQVKNFISVISSQSPLILNDHDKSDLILNIDIKENSYIKSLQTENSIVVNFTLTDTITDNKVYHGVLIKGSKKPIISDGLLFSILDKSYTLLVDTLTETNNEYVMEQERIRIEKEKLLKEQAKNEQNDDKNA